MNLKTVLTQYNFPDHISELILNQGITSLYPPQAEAIEQGVLNGQSLLMSVPTAAGKTLIAELAMIHAILHREGRCLYIAPLKALASEKYKDFKDKYAAFGIQVGLAVGDSDSAQKDLSQYQILIATAEKVDALIRSKTTWLLDDLAVVVLDEIHFLNDGSRGPTLEILIARIQQVNPNVQLLGLSATVSNADAMAEWLGAKLVFSNWRPIPLKEGVYFQNKITFNNDEPKVIREAEPDDLSQLTVDTLKEQGQVLIFVNSRRSAQAVSRQVSRAVARTLTPDEKERLTKLADRISGHRTDATKICQKLGDAVKNGAAFHHAGLKPLQRELIEQNFKNNLIKVISCTPTLAAGVNLPARRAVIRDCKRYEQGLGQAYIPTSEYKQCAGRAGRPQYDTYGEAVLIAKTKSETNTLFDRYINAQPEPVMSKLANESALRIHTLASVAGGYIHDIQGMLDFISHTFLYYQKQASHLESSIKHIFSFLHEEGFIQKSGERYFATPLGSLTSRLYIDPISSIIMRDGLTKIDAENPITPIGIIHLICCCPDTPLSTSFGKQLHMDLESFEAQHRDELLLTPENCRHLDDYYTYLGTLKTTWVALQWIDECKEDTICDTFGIGPGDVYRYIDSVNRMMYAAGRIAVLLRKKSLTFPLEQIRTRVRYGVQKDLLSLVHLKGVGRVRARTLMEHGYTSVTSLKSASVEELSRLSLIGPALAADICRQITILDQTPSA